MSTPRLILKQPTGWFAAGREFAQAITILSDGAFKLYVYACLRAGRHTGCLRATVEELARAVETTPSVIAMNVDELQERAVCCVRRDQSPQLVLEIRDYFWPYQRQQTPESTLGPEAEFVARVRALFLAPACVQASFSAADESWRSTCTDEAFPWNRSRGPSCWDVPASMSPCSTPEPLWFLSFGLTHDDAVCPGKRVASWINVCNFCRATKRKKCLFQNSAASSECHVQPAIDGLIATKNVAPKGC